MGTSLSFQHSRLIQDFARVQGSCALRGWGKRWTCRASGQEDLEEYSFWIYRHNHLWLHDIVYNINIYQHLPNVSKCIQLYQTLTLDLYLLQKACLKLSLCKWSKMIAPHGCTNEAALAAVLAGGNIKPSSMPVTRFIYDYIDSFNFIYMIARTLSYVSRMIPCQECWLMIFVVVFAQDGICQEVATSMGV